ncbi:MAG TPA: APC family permease [Terriglobales bacterium]|jgi:amino acid transporter|nr:APC family permease [Terriglobales bacterium]
MPTPSTNFDLHEVEDTGAHPQPKRALGLRDLVMFYVVTTLSLRWIAVAAAVGPGSLVIWIAGVATVFLPLALCVMELSSRYPQEGGMYVWSKRAFGSFSGFLTGWVYWMSNLAYFPSILYFAASNALYVAGNRGEALQNSPAFFIAFSICGIALALVLNVIGLNIGKWLNNVGAIGAWIPAGLLCIVGAVALHKFGSATSFAPAALKPTLTVGNISVWAALLLAFVGAESASCLGGEIKNARRTIPPALLIAGATITAAYMLGTIAMLIVLPHDRFNYLEGIMQAISSSAERIGWYGLGPAVALLICVANLGTISAYLAAMSRLPFVAGIDRYLPRAFGRVHPRWGTPHVALIVQALCCFVFALLGQLGSTVRGAYQVLVSMTIITSFVPYLFMFAALIRLQREPAGPGIVRIPGGRPAAIAVAIVGLIGTSLALIGSVFPDPSEPHKVLMVTKVVLLSFVVLGGGAGLYLLGKRRAESGLSSD